LRNRASSKPFHNEAITTGCAFRVAEMHGTALPISKEPRVMAFKLPPLPYSENALEPHISARTLQFHHGKHHKKYVDTLNKLIAGTELEKKPLEEIILEAADDLSKQKIFNNAGQHWNHSFFWQCMSPQGGGRPQGELADRLQADFGSFDKFSKEFTAAAEAQFGSGWAWLVVDNGKLKIMTTHDADLPMTHGERALLTCDVWEHAYYLDYQNDRAKFVEVFLAKLANWRFAQEQLSQGGVSMSGEKEGGKIRDGQLKKALGAKHGSEANYAKPSGSDSGVEGEGSYTGTRDYNKGVERTVKSGKIEDKAQEAKRALEGAEGESLREAERRGQMAAKMEDPSLHTKGKGNQQR
jgi:Fe-Mn family superoxide dismutase